MLIFPTKIIKTVNNHKVKKISLGKLDYNKEVAKTLQSSKSKNGYTEMQRKHFTHNPLPLTPQSTAAWGQEWSL